jgi:hypothetical protein
MTNVKMAAVQHPAVEHAVAVAEQGSFRGAGGSLLEKGAMPNKCAPNAKNTAKPTGLDTVAGP